MVSLTEPPVYELMSKCCNQCLTTSRRIVEDHLAERMIRDSQETGDKFICHKATIANRWIACRGVHELTGGCRAWQFATRMGIRVVEIDPETLRRVQ